MRPRTVLFAAVILQATPALAQVGSIPVTISVTSGGESAGAIAALKLSITPLNGGSPLVVTTDSRGQANPRLSPGRYRIHSLNPFRQGGEVYSWDLEATVRPLDKSIIVTLNRQNAMLGIDDAALPQRAPSPPEAATLPKTAKLSIRDDSTAFVAFKSGVIYYRNVRRCEATRIPKNADRVYFRSAEDAQRLGMIPSKETGCQ